MKRLDEKDLKILAELQINSRQSCRNIAKKLKTTSVTVAKRIRALEKQGIIRGYSVDIDYSKLGYKTMAMIEVCVIGNGIEKIENDLKNHPNILNILEVTGQSDLILICRFDDTEKLGKFVKERLVTHPAVKRTNTRMIFNPQEIRLNSFSGMTRVS
jgi:DNA-binding Lrp family transcriptional regulator